MSKCPAPEYRQFDFWLGDWDTFEVVGDTATSIARAHVDLIAGGCAVHELYEQTDGLIGDSILSFDPVRKAWQQTWVTNGGTLMVLTGAFKDGAVTLEGEYHSGQRQEPAASHHLEGRGRRRAGVRGVVEGRRQDLGAGLRRVVQTASLRGAVDGVARRPGPIMGAPCQLPR